MIGLPADNWTQQRADPPLDRRRFAITPDSGITSASHTVFHVGNAVKAAADALRRTEEQSVTATFDPPVTKLDPVTVAFIETADPQGPFDAKGLAEPAVVPVAAAIANAVAAATGVRPCQLPMTPSRLWQQCAK